MYCPKCGRELPDKAVYCPFCGESVISKKKKPVLNMIIGALIAVIALCIVILMLRNNGGSVEIIDQRTQSGSENPAGINDETLQENSNEGETSSTPKQDAEKKNDSTPEEIVTSTPEPTSTPTPTAEPTPTPTPEPTATPTPEPVEVITVIGGIQAPATDFMFPYSSQELLSQEQLDSMISSDRDSMHSASQLAINEMFARHGYTFGTSTQTAREAKSYFESLDWYRNAQPYCSATNWETVRTEYMNDVERENINIINSWQQVHGVYY